jgi:hypothetical protein
MVQSIYENTETRGTIERQRGGELSASDEMIDLVKRFAKEHPDVVALWAFGIGFFFGWKLKPW